MPNQFTFNVEFEFDTSAACLSLQNVFNDAMDKAMKLEGVTSKGATTGATGWDDGTRPSNYREGPKWEVIPETGARGAHP
jgi:hypothetical protein